MININLNTKYNVDFTSNFKKQYKKIVKKSEDVDKFIVVLEKIANGKKIRRKI